MEGASSGLAGHLDNILPNDAQFVLAWNPPQSSTEEEVDVDMPTQEPPDTAPVAMRTTTKVGSSRQAAFYDRHLAPCLILKRVVYFDTLVSTMANTVDRAIQDAVDKRPLPEDTGMLQPEKVIKHQVRGLFRRTLYHELGVANAYSHHAATYCLPIASTLALHPSSEYWDSILNWTTDGKLGRWAIADGLLVISRRVFKDEKWRQELLKDEDDGKKDIMKQLAFRNTTLAVWEMKSLTVGTAEVMQEIAEMGLTHAKFPWKKCTPKVCEHGSLKHMAESKQSYDAGFDPCSPPWTLPSKPSADSRPTPRRQSLRSASIQGGATAGQSYTEPPVSPVEDGEGVGKKRPHSDSDALEYEERPAKKSKADSRDESYEPSPGARQEVNAQSFLQQVAWSSLVQIPILTAFYFRPDMGRGGAQQVHYNGSAFRKS